MRWQPKPLPNFFKPHIWFAWHPIILDTGEIVWLEKVVRILQDHCGGSWWSYSNLTQNKDNT